MKKFTTLLILLLIPVFLFSQVQRKPALTNQGAPVSQSNTKSVKADGDVFWETTFDFQDSSNPLGFSWPEGWTSVDETDFGMPWRWSADSITGLFTQLEGLDSYSQDDGWLVLPADEYNNVDGVATDNAVGAYFQTPIIDCSDKSSVVVKFYQDFRSCCNDSYTLRLMVTNDGGVHWSEYDCRFGTDVNDFALRNDVEINISDVAAGMGQVSLRFRFADASHYFWAIDDLSLSEAFQNELVLEDDRALLYNTLEDNDEGFLPYLPWALMDESGFGQHTFWGAFLNGGINDQENVALQVDVNKNGSAFYSGTSETSIIWALDRDTLTFNDQNFQPDGYGDYHINYTAISDNEEQVPANNKASYYLTVSDSIYSRCDDSAETNQSTSGWIGGNNDGDQLGVIYELTKPLEVNSISVLVTSRPDNPGTGTRPGMECMFWLWKDMGEEGWVPFIASDIYTIEEEDLDEWLTLPMEKDGESEFLEAGTYMAAIQTWHGGGENADNAVFRFSIGYDQSYYSPDGKNGMLFATDEDGWSSPGKLNMIRMNFNESGGPTAATVTFNVDMNGQIMSGDFKPATDFVDIAGTFNDWTGSVQMADNDGDGVYTLAITEIPVFTEMEYKYRINGSWDTSEFPAGGPNREFMVRYFNSTNDLYNDEGYVLGSNPIDLSASISVFPNPNNGRFTISVNQKQSNDLNIQLTNIQGQIVYNKIVTGVLSHQEEINLTDYSKGLYFLRVNNHVKKIIVQ